jgi:hypothetical protein
MKKYFCIICLLFAINSLTAQKAGIDIGWFYSFNTFKLYDNGKYYNGGNYTYYENYENISFKQFVFPSLSIRPYFRLKENFYLVSGVDLLKYSFSYNDRITWSTNPGRINVRIEEKEAHIPLMLNYSLHYVGSKFTTGLYAGVFYRLSYENHHWITNEDPTITWYNVNGKGLNLAGVFENKNRFLNFMVGIKEYIELKPRFSPYIDFNIKYMSGYFYGADNVTPAMPSFVNIEVINRFSFNLGIGIGLHSLKKSPQKHYENPLR